MFDYVVHEPGDRPAKPRFLTTGVSAVVHALILLIAIGLPILYASDELPKVKEMMAFVADAPPPPPPPPPPAPPAPKAKEPPKPNATAIPAEKPLPRTDTVAAPTEAPAEVKPETGAEGNMATGKPVVEAGFEKGVEGGIPGGIVGGIEGAAPAPPPPAPPPKQEGPVRVGGQIKPPQLAKRVNPVYPPAAQAAQVEGSVVLEAVVDKSGRVSTVRVVKGNPLLDQSAITAVKQWQYEPLTLNGDPTSFILTVTVSFSIPR